MEKEQTSKSLGKNLLVALVVLMAWFLLIRVGTSFASKNSFEIIDAEISTKSPYVEISDFNFEKGNIASNVVFHRVGDSVTYKLKMKNTDDTEYIIKSVSDNNKNNCVSYTYANCAGKKVNAQEEFTFELTEKYALENGECVPICNKPDDGTGHMEWNESTKKCVRTCNPGYKMW